MNKKFEDLKEFEEKINYKFKNRNYLISALTHSSYANEVRIPGIVNNERLEFLGDAVLENTSQILPDHAAAAVPMCRPVPLACCPHK